MLTRLLFWNIRRRPISGLITRIARELDLDLMVLAECGQDSSMLVGSLNAAKIGRFWAPHPLAGSLQTFTRLSRSDVSPTFDDPNGHLSITEFHRDIGPNILLAAVHFQSKLFWGPEDQTLHATHLSRRIREQEIELGHRRTIVIGDLNMNPFEPGVVAAHALHAVMTRDFASVQERTVDSESFTMFYNPMWRFFGDDRGAPPGTFWFRPSRPLVYDWNLFDQVLLRPDLMHALAKVQIVDRVDGLSLLLNGRPDPKVGSDHLPLFVGIDL